MKEKREVVKVDESLMEALDQSVERGLAAMSMAGKIGKAIAVAAAISDLRAALTHEVMACVMPLQGSSIGFRTDNDKEGGYPENIVRDCFIEAALTGVDVVGNEFNIIAGKTYITKEGMGKLLSRVDGLAYQITPGIPAMKDGGAVIPMAVEWSYRGKRSERELKLCVKVNSGMGADAIIGKATRKARAWLLQNVTGFEIPEGEAEEINITPAKGSIFEEPKPQAASLSIEELIKNSPVSHEEIMAYEAETMSIVTAENFAQVVNAILDKKEGNLL